MAKLLIVDDEEAINELLKMNLKLVGHEVDQAFDGRQAMNFLEKHSYDLVLLDVMLPYCSGFEILELIARINIVLRRCKNSTDCVVIDDAVIDLNQNLALSREKLLELAWGMDYVDDTRTVDVHIQKLRKKLGLEHRIKTVYKVGYRLEVDS